MLDVDLHPAWFLAMRWMDFLLEFRRGELVFSPEKFGKPVVTWYEPHEHIPFPLLHGSWLYVTELDPRHVENACLLVVKCKSRPLFEYAWEPYDRSKARMPTYRFELEESPEWALHSEGEPPVA